MISSPGCLCLTNGASGWDRALLTTRSRSPFRLPAPWVKPDLPVSLLALVGLAFLLFLSGLEIDIRRLRGRSLTLTAIGFAVSFAIAVVLGIGL